jgi:hypothetical protein
MVLTLLPLLLLTAACDRATGGMEIEDTEQFRIVSTPEVISASTIEGRFEAQGFITDRGRVLEVLGSTEPLSQRSRLYGTQTLEGKRGQSRSSSLRL